MAYAAAFTNDSPVAIGSNYAVEGLAIANSQPVRRCGISWKFQFAYGDFDFARRDLRQRG